MIGVDFIEAQRRTKTALRYVEITGQLIVCSTWVLYGKCYKQDSLCPFAYTHLTHMPGRCGYTFAERKERTLISKLVDVPDYERML